MIHVKRALQEIVIEGGTIEEVTIEDSPIGQEKPDKVKATKLEVTEDFVENVEDHGTVSSGTETFDIEDGTYHIVTVGGDFIAAFLNWPKSGKVSSVTIKLINAGAHTITWPAAVDWAGGAEPSWTASGTDFALFFSDDKGVTISGVRSMEDVK